MNPFLAAARRLGSTVANQWWKQDGLGSELEGMRTVDWEAKWTEGEEETDRTETDTDTETD